MSIVNVTTLNLGNADTATPKNVEVKYVQMTRTFKVNTPKGVKVGHPGDYLIERTDGTRDCILQIEFEAGYEFESTEGLEVSSSQAELALTPVDDDDDGVTIFSTQAEQQTTSEGDDDE